MRNWCARHPIYFMGLYALFYLTFFALLERTIQTPRSVGSLSAG